MSFQNCSLTAHLWETSSGLATNCYDSIHGGEWH